MAPAATGCSSGDDNGGVNEPVVIEGVSHVAAIAAGGQSSCVLLDDGTISCWGRNVSGALGDGTARRSAAFAEVEGISNAIAVTAGAGHTCALLDSGTLSCWGRDDSGQVSTDSPATEDRTPVQIEAVSEALAVAGGLVHSCALLDDGSVACWGDNTSG